MSEQIFGNCAFGHEWASTNLKQQVCKCGEITVIKSTELATLTARCEALEQEKDKSHKHSMESRIVQTIAGEWVVAYLAADVHEALSTLRAEQTRLREALEASLGSDDALSLDMIDVDRLRNWADNFDLFGADVTNWADVRFLHVTLRGLADNIETTVRLIGSARAALSSNRCEALTAERDKDRE
jgi:hypothetical protein